MSATNFPTPISSTCNLLLGDASGLAVLASCTGTPPTTAGVFQHGATMYQTDTGTGANAQFQNTGSTAVPAWTLMDTGTGFTLPTTATDATTTTTTSFALVQNVLTTGTGFSQALNGLTTGVGNLLSHTTAVIADGGSLLRLSSTSIDTGGATHGVLLDLVSTASLAGTQILGTFSGLTTGIGMSLVTAAQTSGTTLSLTGGGANLLAGAEVLDIVMGAATVGSGIDISSTGVYTGTDGLLAVTGNSATTGSLIVVSGTGLTTGNALSITGGGANMTSTGQTVLVSMGAATTGQAIQTTTTGVYTGLNGILQVTANSATTGTIARVNGTGVTSGNVLYVVGGGANLLTSGNIINADMGAGTAGSSILAQSSGAYIGSDGILQVSGTAATTGLLLVVKATQATLTTGRYLSINNATTEVFGIGINGHLISTASANAPSAAITTNQGISAAAITAGGTDTCGTITTTGTQNNTADSTFTVTFGKTYTTAPKAVILTPANAAAALAAQSGAYISSITATTFVVGVSKSSAAAATPSWNYFVIA